MTRLPETWAIRRLGSTWPPAHSFYPSCQVLSPGPPGPGHTQTRSLPAHTPLPLHVPAAAPASEAPPHWELPGAGLVAPPSRSRSAPPRVCTRGRWLSDQLSPPPGVCSGLRFLQGTASLCAGPIPLADGEMNLADRGPHLKGGRKRLKVSQPTLRPEGESCCSKHTGITRRGDGRSRAGGLGELGTHVLGDPEDLGSVAPAVAVPGTAFALSLPPWSALDKVTRWPSQALPKVTSSRLLGAHAALLLSRLGAGRRAGEGWGPRWEQGPPRAERLPALSPLLSRCEWLGWHQHRWHSGASSPCPTPTCARVMQ